jgi:hypothetical protein
MALIQPISVVSKTLGQGMVVDRISHYDVEAKDFIVLLGVVFYDHPTLEYVTPMEVEVLAVLDFPSDDLEEVDEESETDGAIEGEVEDDT